MRRPSERTSAGAQGPAQDAHSRAGLFISFEGGEGTGKSTQATLLGQRLAAEGYLVVPVHEPGGTDLGGYLRTYLKSNTHPLTPAAELFLFVAARAELVRRVIQPQLAAGAIVIADRYADSTTAYQGYGRRVPMRHVEQANALATAGVWPDLTLLLDADPEDALLRARTQGALADTRPPEEREVTAGARASEGDQQRFESAGLAFHRRVRDGYHALATKEPQRWSVIDATQPKDRVAQLVWERVTAVLHTRRVQPAAPGRLPGI